MFDNISIYWNSSAKTYQEILDFLNTSTEQTPIAKLDKAFYKFTIDINLLRSKTESNDQAAGRYGSLSHFLYSIALLRFKRNILQEDFDLLVKYLQLQLEQAKDLAQ